MEILILVMYKYLKIVLKDSMSVRMDESRLWILYEEIGWKKVAKNKAQLAVDSFSV